MLKFLFLVIFVFSFASHGETWKVKERSKAYSPNSFVVFLSHKGGGDFSEALNEIPPNGVLAAIRICCMWTSISSKTHEEIEDFYQTNIPTVFNYISSSSSYTTEEVKPIKDLFNKAVKSTTLYKTLSEKLLSHGYKITKLSHEKLILGRNGSPQFNADLWLVVEKA